MDTIVTKQSTSWMSRVDESAMNDSSDTVVIKGTYFSLYIYTVSGTCIRGEVYDNHYGNLLYSDEAEVKTMDETNATIQSWVDEADKRFTKPPIIVIS